MNAAEGLARQIRRVAEMRERYRSLDGRPGVNVKPVLTMIDAALDQACKAAGSDDAVAVIAAGQQLEGFSE